MKKIVIIIGLLILSLSIYLILPNLNFTGRTIESNLYAYSTAICDEDKYCEDYIVECDGNILQKLTATGFSIQQDNNWKDPRENKEFCN